MFSISEQDINFHSSVGGLTKRQTTRLLQKVLSFSEVKLKEGVDAIKASRLIDCFYKLFREKIKWGLEEEVSDLEIEKKFNETYPMSTPSLSLEDLPPTMSSLIMERKQTKDRKEMIQWVSAILSGSILESEKASKPMKETAEKVEEENRKVLIASYTLQHYFLIPKGVNTQTTTFFVKYNNLFYDDDNGEEVLVQSIHEDEIDWKYPEFTEIQDASNFILMKDEEKADHHEEGSKSLVSKAIENIIMHSFSVELKHFKEDANNTNEELFLEQLNDHILYSYIVVKNDGDKIKIDADIKGIWEDVQDNDDGDDDDDDDDDDDEEVEEEGFNIILIYYDYYYYYFFIIVIYNIRSSTIFSKSCH